MKIVAVAGKMRAGKDTFGEHFLKAFPTFKRVAFADPLKQEFAEIRGLTVDEVNKHKDLYRQDLIDYGQYRRRQDQLYWIKKAIEIPGDKIITDMRFLNEYEAVKSSGAVLIRIESSLEQRSKRGLVIEDSPSETQLDYITDWDFVLTNDEDLETFRLQSEEVIDVLRSSQKIGDS